MTSGQEEEAGEEALLWDETHEALEALAGLKLGVPPAKPAGRAAPPAGAGAGAEAEALAALRGLALAEDLPDPRVLAPRLWDRENEAAAASNEDDLPGPLRAPPAAARLRKGFLAAGPEGAGPTASPAGDSASPEERLRQATRLMQQARYAEAEPLLARLVAERPRHPHPPFFLGCVRQQAGKFADAKALYGAALQLQPELLGARSNLVTTLTRLGEDDLALHHARLLCELDGANAERWFNRGVVEAGMGRPEAAAGSYRRAVELAPTYREAYVNLDSCLLGLGRLDEARRWAQRAVDGAFGFWTHPLQRPPHFVPGLRAKPWWDAADFPWVRKLEAHFETVLKEMLGVLDPEGLRKLLATGSLLNIQGLGRRWGTVGARASHDASLVAAGTWKEFALLGNGALVEENCAKCPVTTRLLTEVRDIAQMAGFGSGEALFSTIAPGTHLRPHCGSTNTRLTAHLGLVVPEGCSIRCGEETRGWREGKCIVFDDSFEHEVWHDGTAVRIVLLINFYHPDVPEEARGPIRPE